MIVGGLALIGIGAGAILKGLHDIDKKAKEKEDKEEKYRQEHWNYTDAIVDESKLVAVIDPWSSGQHHDGRGEKISTEWRCYSAIKILTEMFII